jgi:acyl dehydratase
MIRYDTLRNWEFGELDHTYTERDVILYALGCGMGFEPLDKRQLAFVYEEGLVTMPSMAAVIGTPGSWWRKPGTGVNWKHVLHAEQDVCFFRHFPVRGKMKARNRMTHLHDRGAERGAVAALIRDIFDDQGRPLAQASRIEILRKDGGFSSQNGQHDDLPPRLAQMPEHCSAPADIVVSLPTVSQQALIYRLSGDPNPLHADPDIAAEAGFPRPIFHGLGSYGYAAHAILRACCDYDPTSLRRLAVRFVSPVYPGETLSFHIWRIDNKTVRFRAYAAERDERVLDNGLAEFAM